MNQVIILMKVWMILRIKIMNLQSKRITQSDNYNVWSVYLNEGVNTFKISVPNEDAENVIAKLEGSLLINNLYWRICFMVKFEFEYTEIDGLLYPNIEIASHAERRYHGTYSYLYTSSDGFR